MCLAQFFGVAAAMKADKCKNSLDIGFLSTNGVMVVAKGLSDLVHQAPGLWFETSFGFCWKVWTHLKNTLVFP